MILTACTLVNNVNKVVNVLFRLIFTHHSFAQFESTLISVKTPPFLLSPSLSVRKHCYPLTLNILSFCKWVSCMQHISMFFCFFSMYFNSVFFLITPSAFHCIILTCVFALLYSVVLFLGPVVRRDIKA